MDSLSQILQYKLVAILRGVPAAHVGEVAEALYAGGIRLVEVTLNSENALEVIAGLSHRFQNKLLVGAGTVIYKRDAVNAIAAGATYLISPSLDAAVVKAARNAGVVSIPGAFTPTEMVNAHKAGADLVKLFPCIDAAYVKNVLAPLNFIKLMPTGGIDALNIAAFAKTGAVAFGIGSALVSSTARVDPAYLAGVTEKAKQLVEALAAQ